MDEKTLIEFSISVTEKGANEKLLEILKQNEIEILEHETVDDLATFDCRAISNDSYRAVINGLEDEGIYFYTYLI